MSIQEEQKKVENQCEQEKSVNQNPVTIEVDLLGTFVFDAKYHRFSGKIDWLGEACKVKLYCDQEDGETAEVALKFLREFANDIQGWDSKIRKFAAAQLTKNANDWQSDGYEAEEGEELEEITEEVFMSRMQITTLVIRSDGDYEVWFNDDDMFWGHDILVDGNMNEGIKYADIVG